MIRCVGCRGLLPDSRDPDAILSYVSRLQIRTLDPEPVDRRWLLAVSALSAALELGGYCPTCVLTQQVELLGVRTTHEPEEPPRGKVINLGVRIARKRAQQ